MENFKASSLVLTETNARDLQDELDRYRERCVNLTTELAARDSALHTLKSEIAAFSTCLVNVNEEQAGVFKQSMEELRGEIKSLYNWKRDVASEEVNHDTVAALVKEAIAPLSCTIEELRNELVALKSGGGFSPEGEPVGGLESILEPLKEDLVDI